MARNLCGRLGFGVRMGQVIQSNGIRADPLGDFEVSVDNGALRPTGPVVNDSATGNAEGKPLS
jgi:hypothetical protein